MWNMEKKITCSPFERKNKKNTLNIHARQMKLGTHRVVQRKSEKACKLAEEG
jgi:hypothetical protein